MPQFYLPAKAVEDDRFRIDGPEAFHIAKVLRYQEGQTLELFDGRGGRFSGLISRIAADGTVEGKITGTLGAVAPAPKVDLTLYQGLLKASHWDWLLEKGTEIGVGAFVPVLTPRTVVLLREVERTRAKQERWSRILMAASKQSRRAHLPEISPPAQFRDAIRAAAADGLALLAWEGLAGVSAGQTIRAALQGAAAQASGPVRVNLFVGPEGGFTEEEVELAESLGARLFGMGGNTLRAETAAIAAASLVLYELGAL